MLVFVNQNKCKQRNCSFFTCNMLESRVRPEQQQIIQGHTGLYRHQKHRGLYSKILGPSPSQNAPKIA